MKLTFVVSFVMLVAAATAYAQDAAATCALTVEQAPTIRGLKLGMTTRKVLSLFPGSAEDADIQTNIASAKRAPRYGSLSLNFSPKSYNTGQQFAGINQVSLDLFDNHVYGFRIIYSGPSEPSPWTHVDEFIEKLAKAYKLPSAEAWGPNQSTQSKQLQCVGFSVSVSVETGCCPSIYLGAPFPVQQIDARRRAEQKKARDAFTP